MTAKFMQESQQCPASVRRSSCWTESTVRESRGPAEARQGGEETHGGRVVPDGEVGRNEEEAGKN